MTETEKTILTIQTLERAKMDAKEIWETNCLPIISNLKILKMSSITLQAKPLIQKYY